MNVSTEAAFIMHFLRALGLSSRPGGPVTPRTTYAWGASHDLPTISRLNPPPAADCSGIHNWAFYQVGMLRGDLPLNSAGYLALAQRRNRVISVEEARHQRGAQLVKIGSPGHIATVIGDGWIVHASSGAGGVVVAKWNVVSTWTHGIYLF